MFFLSATNKNAKSFGGYQKMYYLCTRIRENMMAG
jgi:hypothetical protein